MIGCVRIACNQEATVLPVLKLWAFRQDKSRIPPARVQIGLTFCERCRRDTKLEDLVDPKGWKQIVQAFINNHKRPPDLTLTELDWIRITSKEAREFMASIPAPNRNLVN